LKSTGFRINQCFSEGGGYHNDRINKSEFEYGAAEKEELAIPNQTKTGTVASDYYF